MDYLNLPSCLTMLPNLTLDMSEIAKEAVLPKTEVVIANEPVVVLSKADDSNVEIAKEAVVLPKTVMVIANVAVDSEQVVANSEEAAEAVHQDQGARVPQRDEAKGKPVILLLLKKCKDMTGRVERKVHCFIPYFCL